MASSVVSNASPLIALEQISQLPILKGLFGTVVAPPAVIREIAPTVTPPEWMQEQQLTQPIGPIILGASLGVRPCLDGLLNHDFRIAPALYARVLRDAGEDA